MKIARLALIGLLVLAALALIYLLIESIRKPIEFNETRELREEVVRDRLKKTVDLQKMHKSLRGKYASDFDSLKHVLLTDTFYIEMITGDRYDTNQVVRQDTVPFPAKDSLDGYLKKVAPKMSVNEFFAEVRKVPFAKGDKEFYIKTGEAIVDGTDSLMAPTFEIGTTISTYMHEFDSASYVIYDPDYDPNNKVRRVGDLYKPSTSGNW